MRIKVALLGKKARDGEQDSMMSRSSTKSLSEGGRRVRNESKRK